MMLIMDEQELTDFPKVTWAVLFPENSFRTPLKKILKKKCPEIFEVRYPADKGEGINMPKVIVRMLIPEKYRKMPDGSDITDVD